MARQGAINRTEGENPRRQNDFRRISGDRYVGGEHWRRGGGIGSVIG